MRSICCTAALLVLVAVDGFGPATAQAEPAPGPASVITLDEARARALERNPALAAAGSAARSAGGTWRQARAWPNPELGIEAEEFGGDRAGWDEASVTWSLTQRLELFGTRGARARAGRFGYEASAAELERARLDLGAEVERRFAAVLAAQDRLAALEESDRIAAEALAAVRSLVEAGEVSPVEADRAEAERARVGIAHRAATVEITSTRRALAQLWGEAAPDFAQAAGTLDFLPVASSWDSLGTLGLASPELRQWDAELARAEAERSRVGRGRWPEVALGAGMRRFPGTGDRTYVASLGLALPLLDRRGGAVEAADAEVARIGAQRREAEVRLAGDLAGAVDALENAARAAATMRESVLPRARAVHEALGEGYRRGKFGLLDLLDAQRTWIETRLQYVDLLEDLWAARADLGRLSGRSLTTPAAEGESR
jgi:cobalt-zinc-cadmium efflux system outer membrane protein